MEQLQQLRDTGTCSYIPPYPLADHTVPAKSCKLSTATRNAVNCLCLCFLGPELCVYVNPQGLQGSHLNLSQASAQRHRRYFLLNNSL